MNMFVKLFQFQSVYKTCYKTMGKSVNCCGNPGNHEFAHTPQIFGIMQQVTLFFPIFVFSLYSGVFKDDRCNINQRIFLHAAPQFWKTVHGQFHANVNLYGVFQNNLKSKVLYTVVTRINRTFSISHIKNY